MKSSEKTIKKTLQRKKDYQKNEDEIQQEKNNEG